MQSYIPQQPRLKTRILCAACIALAFMSASCGGGATEAISTATATPGISLSPVSLSFASQLVGNSSTAQSIALTNTGSGDLTISSITASGDFTQTNNCKASLPAGNSCTISVTFTPSGSGTRTGTVSIADSASGGPHTVTLTGIGTSTANVASTSPSSLTFASQNVGTTSSAQAVTLANTGSATLTISGIAVTGTNAGDFAQSNNCGSSVAAGGSCMISVTFTPTATGTRTAAITITDNASSSPNTVSLSGTGATNTSTPTAHLSATSLTFASQNVGTTSSAQAVTLANTGSATLTISGIAVTGTNAGDFAQSNNCGSSVAAGGSCTISVTFTPTATGTRTAAITITDNASGSPQTVSLTGTEASGQISINPTSTAFGDVVLSFTPSLPVIITNTGTASVTVSQASVTGTGFSLGGLSLPLTLSAGQSTSLNVTFSPTAVGTDTGNVSIVSNATNSPTSEPLSGTGVHGVSLSWTASTSPGVMGYYVYRGATIGGEGSTPLNSTPVNSISYLDESVTAGSTYYYVVTAVASDGVTQSAHSSEAAATIPSP